VILFCVFQGFTAFFSVAAVMSNSKVQILTDRFDQGKVEKEKKEKKQSTAKMIAKQKEGAVKKNVENFEVLSSQAEDVLLRPLPTDAPPEKPPRATLSLQLSKKVSPISSPNNQR
jgi:hypothetical protein